MKYTVADVKRAYKEGKFQKEKQRNFIAYITYRQISFYLTPIFLKFSVSANTVSLFAFFSTLSLPIVSLWGGELAYLYAALICLFFHILDHVDGNIARTTGKTSMFGQYLDSFSGNLYWIIIYTSIGILLEYREGTGIFFSKGGLVIGLLAALFDIFAKESRLYAKLHFADTALEYISDKVSLKNIILSSIGGFGLLIPLLLILFGALKSIDILLILLCVHAFLILLYTQIKIFSYLLRVKAQKK